MPLNRNQNQPQSQQGQQQPARPQQPNRDPVIQALARRAQENPPLKGLLKLAAARQANKEQLAEVRRHIDELSRTIRAQQSTGSPLTLQPRTKTAAPSPAPTGPQNLQQHPQATNTLPTLPAELLSIILDYTLTHHLNTLCQHIASALDKNNDAFINAPVLRTAVELSRQSHYLGAIILPLLNRHLNHINVLIREANTTLDTLTPRYPGTSALGTRVNGTTNFRLLKQKPVFALRTRNSTVYSFRSACSICEHSGKPNPYEHTTQNYYPALLPGIDSTYNAVDADTTWRTYVQASWVVRRSVREVLGFVNRVSRDHESRGGGAVGDAVVGGEWTRCIGFGGAGVGMGGMEKVDRRRDLVGGEGECGEDAEGLEEEGEANEQVYGVFIMEDDTDAGAY